MKKKQSYACAAVLIVITMLSWSVGAAEQVQERDYINEARWLYSAFACGSGEKPSGVDQALFRTHCREITNAGDRYRENFVVRVRRFMNTHKKVKTHDTVVYPFGGGDLFCALAVYPDGKEYITISLESAGDPVKIFNADNRRLADSLDYFRRILKNFYGMNDNTNDNARAFEKSDVPGQLAMSLAAAALFGYDGSFNFQAIGNAYGTLPVHGLRIVPALSGIGLSLLFFVLLQQLGVSRAGAFLGALWITLDNALLVQTRIIAIDGILLAGIFGSLSLFLAARESGGAGRTLLLLCCGAAAGYAVGTKFTGLTALALPIVFSVLRILVKRTGNVLTEEIGACLWILAGAVVVYCSGWYLHFALLAAPGPGDAFYKPQGRFWFDLFNLHAVMFKYNYFLDKTHTYSSPWWSWPFMVRPIYYWSGSGTGIYFLGNPAVWWGGIVAFLEAVAWKLFRLSGKARRPFTEREMIRWLPLAGYVIAYLPHGIIPRVLFMYHYLPPLLFSVAFLVPVLEESGWIRPGGFARQRPLYWTAIVLLMAGFLFITPLTFGWPYPDPYARVVFGMLFPR